MSTLPEVPSCKLTFTVLAPETKIQITGRPESALWLLGGKKDALWFLGWTVFGALEIDLWGSVAASHVTRVGEGTLLQSEQWCLVGWQTRVVQGLHGAGQDHRETTLLSVSSWILTWWSFYSSVTFQPGFQAVGLSPWTVSILDLFWMLLCVCGGGWR